jgi:hypothetical protein
MSLAVSPIGVPHQRVRGLIAASALSALSGTKKETPPSGD